MRFGGMIGIVETIVVSLLLVMRAPIPSLALPLDTCTFEGLPPVEEFIVSHLGIIRVSIRALLFCTAPGLSLASIARVYHCGNGCRLLGQQRVRFVAT